VAAPTKFSPFVERAILSSLRAGATRTAASEAAGIHRDTFREWARANSAFSAAVEKAEAQAEANAVRVVRTAMADHWQAAAWWLERRRPNEFGRIDRVEVMLRREAERIAGELGMEVEDVIREAERITGNG
jgi:CRP-like cAMP-binding protein